MTVDPEIGLGMYTVHETAERDMAGTFGALGEMGYRGIELYGDAESLAPGRTRRALAAGGLRLYGWHVEWRETRPDRLENTLAALDALGCPVLVVPCLGGRWHIGHDETGECLDTWLGYIDELNALSRRLAPCGVRLAYHNHDHEFRLAYRGKTVFRWLFDALAPDVLMELDTGNCIEGGGDPVEELRRYAGRETLLHMKPYSPSRGFDVTLGEPEDANDWRAIRDAVGERPCRLLVESEATDWPEMENARRCLLGARRAFGGANERR